jgi:hypothetical protein
MAQKKAEQMTRLAVIGVDPGPCSGIVLLNWKEHTTPGWPPGWVDSYQCDAVNAPGMLTWVLRKALENECQLRGAIEEFREGVRSTRTKNPQDAGLTRALVPTLRMTADVFGLKLRVRPAAVVKPWATDRRMDASGVWKAVPVKMIDSRSAAQQAVYESVHGGKLTDPLSRKAKN